MEISLASGEPFLGHFPVSGQCPVAFVSGESGRATLQRAAKVMADARGAKINDENFFIGFDLPRLSHRDHLTAIADAIRAYGIKFFCIDPAYLATLTLGNADKAQNQFAMGLILEPFGRIGVETGCTMALVHHARKPSKAEAYKPMTRDDLTQSGFDAWMRQWLLISRRSPFRGGSHELHIEAGGSAGHCGQWHVDIDEGRPADPLIGRRWEVKVTEADSVDAAATDAKTETDAKAGLAAVLHAKGGGLSRRAFCKAIQAGCESGGRADRALNYLTTAGLASVVEASGRGGRQSRIVATETVMFNA
jgi:hypothetical protein